MSLIASLVASTPVAARGDDANRCSDAYVQAQTLRDQHKLKEAREQMRFCSQSPPCSPLVAKDCAAWLDDIERIMPSVVFSAATPKGAALPDVAVRVDGVQVAAKLDGEAVEIDPGEHTCTFEATDGRKSEQSCTVYEGQKAALVKGILPDSQVEQHGQGSDQTKPPPNFWTTPRTIGAAVGGVGAAGVVVGSVFGLLALSAWNQQKNSCESPTECPNRAQALSDHASLTSDSAVSTAAFIVGGVGLAAGAAVFFLVGRSNTTTTGWIVAPSAGPGGESLLLEGQF